MKLKNIIFYVMMGVASPFIYGENQALVGPDEPLQYKNIVRGTTGASENEQGISENKQSASENEQGISENKQSISENEQNISINKQSQEGREIAGLQWKIGVGIFNKKSGNQDKVGKEEITVYKAPLVLELQIPFRVKMRGLAQAGLGAIWINNKKCEKEAPVLRMVHDTGKTDIIQTTKCDKWKEEKPVSTGFLTGSAGLEYDFGPFRGVLQGGALLNMKKEFGFTLGLFFRDVIVKGLDLGMEMLSYDNQNFFGVSLMWGTSLKTWTRRE